MRYPRGRGSLRRGKEGRCLADQKSRIFPILGRDVREVVREMHGSLAVLPPVDVGTGGSGGRQKDEEESGSSQEGERQACGPDRPDSGRAGFHHRTM